MAPERPSASPALSPRAAALLLLALVLIWGANWPIMKVGVLLVPPFWFAVLRFLMGAACLFLLLACLRRLSLPPRHDLPVVVAVGLLQMAGYLGLVNLALQWVPAGRSALLAYTTPLWVAPGAALLLGEAFTWRRALGLALGLGGLLVLFNPLDFPWHDGTALLGNALLLAAAFLWSLAILAIRRHRWQAGPLQLAPWQLLLAALVLLPVALWQEGWPDLEPSWALAWILAYNGPLATAFCFWASLSLTRGLPAVTVSLGMLGVPAAGLAFSTLLLDEALTLSLVLGMLLILAGLIIVTLPERRR